jgi:hypothetical protein
MADDLVKTGTKQVLIHRGGCHCGVIRMTYSSAVPAAEHALRACQCSFCRKHGSIAVSDPEGSVEIKVADGQKASRYRFGLGTAEYIVCRDCGVYVAAVMIEGQRSWSVTIVNALDDRADFSGAVEPVDFSTEDEDGRRARRRARWTPTIFVHR